MPLSIRARVRSRISPLLLVSAVAAMASAACGEPSAQEESGPLESAAVADAGLPPPGSAVAVHGMVLFGSERLYLSHIPLFGAPHNLQVVVEVKITSGVPTAQQTFATRGFSFQPKTAFSLGDLARGQVRNLQGTIFLGNFEAGGTPAFQNVTFEVTRVIFQRTMTATLAQSPALEYVAVGTPSEPFFVHVIDRAPSFDSVVRVAFAPDASLDEDDLAEGTLVRIANRANSVATRLGTNVQGEAVEVGAPSPGGDAGAASPATTRFKVLNENSCLKGPDFFNPCPPPQP